MLEGEKMMDEARFQDAGMPVSRLKRTHKKSRSGCATCKRRRVKCDETRPRCKRCHLRRLECAFPEGKPPHSPLGFTADTEKALKTFRSKNLHSSPGETKLRVSIDVADAELAQHYLTHTAQTITDASIRKEHSNVWRIFIPAVAVVSLVVRRGMLTLAAICLHHDSAAVASGEHSSKYLEAAEAHGIVFVAESRQKLQDLQPSEINSNLACSRLLCVLGFAFFRVHRRNGVTLSDRAAWTWLQLLRGVKVTFDAKREPNQDVDEIITKDMVPELPSDIRPYSPSAARRPGLSCNHPSFPFFRRTRRERFDALRATLHGDWLALGHQKTKDLGDAIDILHQVTEHVCSHEVHSLFRAMCTWPSRLPKGFVDMLTDGCPPALAVYAHWLMLVALLENLWWVGDMGRAGIRDVINLCSDASSHVRALLIWPQLILDTEIHSTNCTPGAG